MKNRDILEKILDALGELPQGLLYEHTVTGNPATFNTNVVKPVSMEIPFYLEQDLHGQEYPWPAGGGKNLFPEQNVSGTQRANINVTIPAGTYTISAEVTSSDTDYTTSAVYATFTDNTGETVGQVSRGTRSSATFTVEKEIKTITLYASDSNSHSSGQTFTWSNVQIESGSSATTYAPYANICPITEWTGCEVSRTGADTINISFPVSTRTFCDGTLAINKDGTGKLVVNWVGEIAPTNWKKSSDTVYVERSTKKRGTRSARCSHYNVIAYTSSDRIAITVGVMSATEFNNLVAEYNTTTTPMQICYLLATPLEYDLTTTEVGQIMTILGTNSIGTDTNGTNTINYMKRG